MQGTHRGKFRGGTKFFVQTHKPPIARHTQHQIRAIHYPKGGLVVGPRDIRRGGNRVRMKFLQYIRTQSILARGDLTLETCRVVESKLNARKHFLQGFRPLAVHPIRR